MSNDDNWQPDLNFWRIFQADPGWIYAVKSGDFIKIGQTIDPQRRLLREARTWSPNELEIVGVKPFWNIRKVEYSLHSALAEHWHRGEWHKFNDAYWLNFFVEAFKQFSNVNRDSNSVNFTYWMNGTNYAEYVIEQARLRIPLRQWQECHARPC
jgi:hypothetical protein